MIKNFTLYFLQILFIFFLRFIIYNFADGTIAARLDSFTPGTLLEPLLRHVRDTVQIYKKPEKESYQSKPDEVPYPKNDIRFKHYGKIMEDMVKSASELSEGEDKEKLVKHIANLLKTSYLQWNRDSVNDSLIIKQLEELSVGKLTISADKLRDTSDIVRTFKKKKSNNKNYTKNKPRRKYHGSFWNNWR